MNQQQASQQYEPQPPAYDHSVYGPQQLPATDPRRRSPAVAAILSVMPGLGQVYLGYTQRGFIHVGVVGCLIAFLASRPPDAFIGIAALVLPFFWLYNIIDAARLAVLYNEALAGRNEIDLPKPVEAGMHGSVAGGVTLTVFGALLLANTAFDLSLEWLREWWPLAIVLFGLYLIYRARADRASRRHQEPTFEPEEASTSDEDTEDLGPAVR